MCLILFAWKAHPRHRLVLAANRDEFHDRPTEPAGFWQRAPQLLAGRDLEAGGTWLGVTRTGRFAAVTNFREPSGENTPAERSRGRLVTDYLAGRNSPLMAAERLKQEAKAYLGFNLLLGNFDSLVHVSNRDGAPTPVTPGVHGLSNHMLDTPWPKVRAGTRRLDNLLQHEAIEAEALLEILADRSAVPGGEPPEFDPALAPEMVTRMAFILSPRYGTRSSTVLLIDEGGEVFFLERQFDAIGRATGTVEERFEIRHSPG